MMQKIYDKSPVFIQNLMCSGQGWLIKRRRYNKAFYKELDFYLKHKADGVVLLDMFLNGLKDVPAYKDVFANREHVSLSDFPIINKQQVKSHLEDFRNPSYKGNVIEMRTSGTSGSGLIFPYSVEMENKQWAVWWRYRIELGITLDTWCGWFGGKEIVSHLVNNSPFWRVNQPGKQVMYSSYHLNKGTILKYYQDIVNRNLSWLHGYPSHMAKFASLFLDAGLGPLNEVRFVTTGSENVLGNQMTIMKKAFPNALIRQHYGLNEGVANISQDLFGKWHVDDDFCAVEFIPVNSECPEVCRIIGTGFSNKAFPLVRYDTGDLATVIYDTDGSVRQIVSIDGRSSNEIIQPSGHNICEASLSIVLHDFMNIQEAQFYQLSGTEVELRVVKGAKFGDADESKLRKALSLTFEPEMDVSIKYVAAVERTKAGKMKLVVNDNNI